MKTGFHKSQGTEIRRTDWSTPILIQQEIFKTFQATTVTNRFNPLSLPDWIQHTRIRDENRDLGKSGKSLMKTGRGLPPLYVIWRI